MIISQVGKWFSITFVVALVLWLSACSQNPARISDNGDKFYGFGGEVSSYKPKSKPSSSSFSNTGSKKYVWTTVRRGDTVSEIAEDYGVSTKQLAKLNHLRRPYRIKVGQVLKIGKAKYHIVKRGDTLKHIASDYAVDMNKLASANKIKAPYNIKIGQKLYMPGAPKTPRTTVAGGKKKNYSRYNKRRSYTGFSSKKNKGKRVTLSGAPKFAWPVRGRVINSFGAKSGGVYNDGINISAKAGAPVKASAAGTVVYVGSELKAYGNLVIVQHKGGWLTAYAHNKKIVVKKGQRIKQGQKIATVGASGKVDKPQVHFAVRKGREAVNPRNYL
jgi:murein DD-endopeptidase MepM/ murein hydrolase activator NlpD